MKSKEELGLRIVLDFISEEQEKVLVANFPKKSAKATHKRNSIHRYGSSIPYGDNMKGKDIPAYLNAVAEQMVRGGLLSEMPDHCTINEYYPKQIIALHTDSNSSGEVISIISLLGESEMTFKRGEEQFSVIMPRRSLVQMRNEIRYLYQHGILKNDKLRYSIVFRKGTE